MADTYDFAGLSPEMLAQIIALGGIPEQQSMNMAQRQTGMDLFNTPGPQGYHAGGTFVAASPLEHIGNLVMRGVGAHKARTAEDQYKALLGQQTAGRQAFANALLRGGAPQPAPQPVQPTPGPDQSVNPYARALLAPVY